MNAGQANIERNVIICGSVGAVILFFVMMLFFAPSSVLIQRYPSPPQMVRDFFSLTIFYKDPKGIIRERIPLKMVFFVFRYVWTWGTLSLIFLSLAANIDFFREISISVSRFL